jgi:hypothetical protein
MRRKRCKTRFPGTDFPKKDGEKEKKMKTRKKLILALAATLALGVGAAKTALAGNPADLDLYVTFNGQLSVAVDGVGASSVTLQAYDDGTNTLEGNPYKNAYAAPVTSDTVTNNGSIVEQWELDASTQSGGGNWELTDATGTAAPILSAQNQETCSGTCPGANQYAIQALFVSSNTTAGVYGSGNDCIAVSSTAWDANSSTIPVHAGWASATAANPGYVVYTSTAVASPEIINGTNGYPDYNVLGVNHFTGTSSPGDMLPLGDQTPGNGQRGLCVRVTMPSATSTTATQEIQLEITAIGG